MALPRKELKVFTRMGLTITGELWAFIRERMFRGHARGERTFQIQDVQEALDPDKPAEEDLLAECDDLRDDHGNFYFCFDEFEVDHILKGKE